VVTGGLAQASPLKLAEAANALFYAGSRDVLFTVNMPKSELDGTAYGKEMARRIMIETGQTLEFTQQPEEPQLRPPHPLPPPRRASMTRSLLDPHPSENSQMICRFVQFQMVCCRRGVRCGEVAGPSGW